MQEWLQQPRLRTIVTQFQKPEEIAEKSKGCGKRQGITLKLAGQQHRPRNRQRHHHDKNKRWQNATRTTPIELGNADASGFVKLIDQKTCDQKT